MSISDGLFERFKKILFAGPEGKRQFIAICREQYGLALADTEVVVKDATARIVASPAVKNKVFTIKVALLEELKKQNSPIREIVF